MCKYASAYVGLTFQRCFKEKHVIYLNPYYTQKFLLIELYFIFNGGNKIIYNYYNKIIYNNIINFLSGYIGEIIDIYIETISQFVF